MAGSDIRFKKAKSLTLQEISVKRMLTRTVSSNNKSSGKLTLPKELIGKEVYVILPK